MKSNVKKLLSSLLVLMMIFSVATPVMSAGDTMVVTALRDGMEQRGSKLAFEVYARDSGGKKIQSGVTLNDAPVNPTWDDSNQTSYTLEFDSIGIYTVVVTAGSAYASYVIDYIGASPGDVIGAFTACVEVFMLGEGYLVEPIIVEIIEGRNAAWHLEEMLASCGYTTSHSGQGSPDYLYYYLSVIHGGRINEIPIDGAELNLSQDLQDILEANYWWPYRDRADVGALSEFDYTFGSGWMYFINGRLPNLGMDQYWLSDGDVMRVQFTVAYGSDLGSGGGGYGGADFIFASDKDMLTTAIAKINSAYDKADMLADYDILSAYNNAYTVLVDRLSTQMSIDGAYAALSSAVAAYNLGQVTGPEITVANSTGTNPVATVAPPAGGWASGSNTFTVSAPLACAAAVSYDEGASYTRLSATPTGEEDTYSFTVNLTGDATIAVVLKGDANGDGQVSNADVTRISAVIRGMTSFTGWTYRLAADVNADDSISNADLTRLKAVCLLRTELSW